MKIFILTILILFSCSTYKSSQEIQKEINALKNMGHCKIDIHGHKYEFKADIGECLKITIWAKEIEQNTIFYDGWI